MQDNGSYAPGSILAAQQLLLAKRLQLLLSILHPDLCPDVVLALQAPGKLLSPVSSHSENSTMHPNQTEASSIPSGVWPLLTLLLAQHLAPELEPFLVGDLAIAVECFICALDLLDDVEDGDQTAFVESIGAPRMLNVSTTLLMLAQRALLSLSAYRVTPERILCLLDTLQGAALTATGCQHRDLLAEQQPVQDFSQEVCIEIAASKAGSLMRLACVLAALCAGASDELCELCARLGEFLGIAHQLDNDCHDVAAYLYDEASAQRVKTDVQRGKKTLPLVLAAAERIPQEEALLSEPAARTDTQRQEDERRALREGILATWGICLLYRERARDCLQEIEARTRPLTPALRHLLGL